MKPHENSCLPELVTTKVLYVYSLLFSTSNLPVHNVVSDNSGILPKMPKSTGAAGAKNRNAKRKNSADEIR
jgi:hypothetical protein